MIAAGLAYVDEHGLDALSMRKLGASLGVEAMSLYNYVANKDDLYEGIAALLLELVEVPDHRPGEWRREVTDLCLSVRAMGVAHPNAFPLLITQTHTSLEGWAPFLAGFVALREAGLPDADAIEAVSTISAFIVGAILLELSALARGARLGPALSAAEVPEDQALLREYLDGPRPDSFEQLYARGIELYLDGIAQKLHGRS